MLSVVKMNTGFGVVGVASTPTLVLIKTAAGVRPEAIEAGAVCKSYETAQEVYVLPVAKSGQTPRKSPPEGYPESKDEYAVPDKYLFPISTESHVRSAIGYFSAHHWEPSDDKKGAANRILRAAKRFGIEVNQSSDVYRSAKGL